MNQEADPSRPASTETPVVEQLRLELEELKRHHAETEQLMARMAKSLHGIHRDLVSFKKVKSEIQVIRSYADTTRAAAVAIFVMIALTLVYSVIRWVAA